MSEWERKGISAILSVAWLLVSRVFHNLLSYWVWVRDANLTNEINVHWLILLTLKDDRADVTSLFPSLGNEGNHT